MLNFQSVFDFFKKPGFILILILAAFILKGLVFAVTTPLFQGASGDEYVHYATVQYMAEPKEKTWPISKVPRTTDNNKNADIFNYTQEISRYAELTQSRKFSGQPHNTPIFDENTVQYAGNEMRSGKYLPFFDKYPITVAGRADGYSKLAHRIGALIEKILAPRSIFERTFALRLLAVFYGFITVLSAYFISLWSGMRKKHALLIAGIVSFQPQFSATTAIISYDPLLIALFSLFLLAAVSVLSHRLNWKNGPALILIPILAVLAKPIGGILLFLAAGVLLFGLRERFAYLKEISLWKYAIAALLTFAAVFILAPERYTSLLTAIPPESRGQSLSDSFKSYLNAQAFNIGRYQRASVTYWGTFGWMDTALPESIVKNIRRIEYASAIGFLFFFLAFIAIKFKSLILALFRKSSFGVHSEAENSFIQRSFLPRKRFLMLFALSILLLQLGTRFYDWQGIYLRGEGVGVVGRYFLPNIIPHMIIVATGLGLFVWSSRYFGLILKSLFALMVLLSFYSTFILIIPRYFL